MKKIFLLIAACCLSMAVSGQEFDSEVLSHVSYRYVSKNKLTRTDTVVLQINKRMGDDDASVVIPFSKNEKLSIGDAWIEDKQGKVVRKLKKSDINEYSAISNSSLYEDDFIRQFELKHNDYPYKVVYSFKIVTSNFLAIVNEQPSPTTRRRVRNMKIVVNTPVDFPIRYQQNNVNTPTIDTIDDNRRLVWQYSHIPIKRQTNAPISSLKLPQVTVLPLSFNYGKAGSWDSWQSFGDWIYRLNDKQDELPDTEKTKINQLLKGITDPREKAKVLYYYLQDYTRYINVKIDVGGLKAYPASYVSVNKYGDCKALCNYMKAMLSYVGIKSYYTIIEAGDDIMAVDKSFPFQVFNHVIVTVPFENDTVFLECTSKNSPFGYLGTFTQGREAFIVDADNKSRFITTPSLTANDVLCERWTGILVSFSVADVNLRMKQRGEDYEGYTYLKAAYNRSVAEQYIRNYMMPGTLELIDFSFKEQARDRAEIDFSAKFKVRDIAKAYGNNLIITSFPREVDLYETPENRTQPIQIDCPVFYKDTVEYVFSSDMKNTSPLAEVVINSKYGNYHLSSSYNGEVLQLTKTILINKGYYPLSEYNDFYKFISDIKNNEKKSIYINK